MYQGQQLSIISTNNNKQQHPKLEERGEEEKCLWQMRRDLVAINDL